MALSQNDWCPTKERKQTHREKGAEKTQTATCQQRQSRAPLGRAPRGLVSSRARMPAALPPVLPQPARWLPGPRGAGRGAVPSTAPWEPLLERNLAGWGRQTAG